MWVGLSVFPIKKKIITAKLFKTVFFLTIAAWAQHMQQVEQTQPQTLFCKDSLKKK